MGQDKLLELRQTQFRWNPLPALKISHFNRQSIEMVRTSTGKIRNGRSQRRKDRFGPAGKPATTSRSATQLLSARLHYCDKTRYLAPPGAPDSPALGVELRHLHAVASLAHFCDDKVLHGRGEGLGFVVSVDDQDVHRRLTFCAQRRVGLAGRQCAGGCRLNRCTSETATPACACWCLGPD